MFLTLLYWMFVFLLMVAIGFSFVKITLKKDTLKKERTLDTYFFTGFILVVVFSGYWSIFLPLSQWVLLGAVIVGIGLYTINRREVNSILKENWKKISQLATIEKTTVLIGFLFFGIMASQEIWVYDTKLYHAQNVQWIQKYAVVPGLASFQPQFGFNNMFFPVTALFTIDLPTFYQNQSLLLYPFNAVIIIVLLGKILFFLQKALHAKDWWYAFVYSIILGCCFVFFPRGLNSPAPDYVCAALVIYIFLELEKKAFKLKSFQALLFSGIIITAIIFKLSALLLSILLLPLIFTNYSFKKVSTIAGLALLIGLPFFIRNYYLSGYLIFPFPAIDLFNPEWKIPNEVVALEKMLIKSWAKIPNSDSNTIEAMPFMDWFTVWWGNKDLILWKPLLSINLLSVLSIPIFLKKRRMLFASLQVAILLNLAFWFYNAPDPRFVFGFLFLGASFTIGSFLLLFDMWKYLSRPLLVGLLGLFMAFSINFHKLYIRDFLVAPVTWVIPKGLPSTNLTSVRTNFRYTMPVRPDLCNNSPLPCATRPLGKIVLRDTINIQKGFKIIDESFLIDK